MHDLLTLSDRYKYPSMRSHEVEAIRRSLGWPYQAWACEQRQDCDAFSFVERNKIIEGSSYRGFSRVIEGSRYRGLELSRVHVIKGSSYRRFELSKVSY